jgi:hypothetical protein
VATLTATKRRVGRILHRTFPAEPEINVDCGGTHFLEITEKSTATKGEAKKSTSIYCCLVEFLAAKQNRAKGITSKNERGRAGRRGKPQRLMWLRTVIANERDYLKSMKQL